MKTLLIKKTKKVVTVDNGVAHGMIERGEATLLNQPIKEMSKAPHDKMMDPKRHRITKK